MISTENFIRTLERNGYDFFTGVPCSILKGIIKNLSENADYNYIPATREDAAVGIACGAYMAGKKPVLLMQNSGLGYCLNAITSLSMIYKIPFLMIISWRGFQGKDAPEHLVMGDVCTKLLDVVELPFLVIEEENFDQHVEEITAQMEKIQMPVGLFLKRGIVE